MSLVPVPQLVAESLTTAAITIGAKDNATKLARAKTAAQVAAFFTAAGKGDIQGASQQVQTWIPTINDPGAQQLASDLWSVGRPFLDAELTLLDGFLEGAFASIGLGMSSVAGAYIGKLSTPAA